MGTHAGHDHGASLSTSRHKQRRALWFALAANAIYMVAEIVGGIAFNSLALLADAAHMASDVAGLVIALVAQSLAARPPSRRHSYGLQRAEVLGAQFNALLLLGASAWIVLEAFHRLDQPGSVDGAGVIVVAGLGLVVNLVSAVVLYRAAGESLNMRGAFIHMASDAAGSVGAIIAGVAVVVWSADRVDPIVSVFIALLVVWAAVGLLRDSTSILLEGLPRGIDPVAVRDQLEADDRVSAVHHLHLWALASDQPAMSAHVVLDGVDTLHDAQTIGDDLKQDLAHGFGIAHATLELECHPCDEPGDAVLFAEAPSQGDDSRA